jgi:hypothetical protein
MNLQHAVVVSLLGWYLMLPPLVPLTSSAIPLPFQFQADDPISQWDEQSSFDSADACEKAKAKLVTCGEILKGFETGDPKEPCDGMTQTVAQAKNKQQESATFNIANRKTMAQCIATDDPRLKGD